MAERGWKGADKWREAANTIAPTIVGGSKKHGGPDLGPTRAKKAWSALKVNGHSIAEHAPGPDFAADELPRLTVKMVARLQGFPDNWEFVGRKTAAYRQVGNAFPPPVARAIGNVSDMQFQCGSAAKTLHKRATLLRVMNMIEEVSASTLLRPTCESHYLNALSTKSTLSLMI